MWRIPFRRLRLALGLSLSAASTLAMAGGQAVTTPYAYSRTAEFVYRADGLLLTEFVERDNAQLCAQTTHTYDDYGNKTGSRTEPCPSAASSAQFVPRQSRSTFEARQVTLEGRLVDVPAGSFVTQTRSAVNGQPDAASAHVVSQRVDPRFGQPLETTGVNGLTTRWVLDAFGRPVRETRPDGSEATVAYCLLPAPGRDLSSNSVDCPTSPPGLGTATLPITRFEHHRLRNGGQNLAPDRYVFFDAAGRRVRTLTAAMRGSSPDWIAQDEHYNVHGALFLTTQPYFLSSGSSQATGSEPAGATLTQYDALGRPIAIFVADRQGSESIVFGSGAARPAAVTRIDYAGLRVTTTQFIASRAGAGQPLVVTQRQRIEEKDPEGKLIRATDSTGAQLLHIHDAFGNLIRTRDPLGRSIAITYDQRGRRLSLDDPNAGLTVYCYDAAGQLRAQQTSAMRNGAAPGACPNAGGAATTATAVTNWTTLAYDGLGRLTSRQEPEGHTRWHFDVRASGNACAMGIGKLCEVVSAGGITKRYHFDDRGRPVSEVTIAGVADGPTVRQLTASASVAYHPQTGRVQFRTYPSGLRVEQTYNPVTGQLAQLLLATSVSGQTLPAAPGGATKTLNLPAGATALWTAGTRDAWGRTTSATLSNQVVQGITVDAQTGRMERLTAATGTGATLMHQELAWDTAAQLVRRVDHVGTNNGAVQVQDVFQYDTVGRMVRYEVSGGSTGAPLARAVQLQYNAMGLLLGRSDVGNFSYPARDSGAPQPHGVRSVSGPHTATYSYDASGRLITATGASRYGTVEYGSHDQPLRAVGGGGLTYRWYHDEDRRRLLEQRTQGTAVRLTWYLHPDNVGGLAFEREEHLGGANSGQAVNRHYLSAEGQPLGVLITQGALAPVGGAQEQPTAASSLNGNKLEYWHRDHLGSLVATTDHEGARTAAYSYDPFGRRRHVSGQYDMFGALVIDYRLEVNHGSDRGFTGHEHLDDIGLVHMNGRLYDPILGRFLQADPFIQDPGNLQNYSRYTYCFNSPGSCTDPSGQIFEWFATGILTNLLIKEVPELRPFVAIAFAVALGPGGPAAMFSGSWAGIANAATAGFVSGAISTGTFKGGVQGAFSAMAFNWVGTQLKAAELAGAERFFTSVTAHAITGCVTSAASGGNCGQGALSAAFSKAATFLPGMEGINAAAERGDITARIQGTVISAVVGGTASVLGGGKFANGAQTGAFSYLFNQLGSSPEENLTPVGGEPMGAVEFAVGAAETVTMALPGGFLVGAGVKVARATDLAVLVRGSKAWDEAVEALATLGRAKADFRVATAADARALLTEARGRMNRYKQYTQQAYRKGFEIHNQMNQRELAVGNNLQHLKWRDGKSGGHIFFDRPN